MNIDLYNEDCIEGLKRIPDGSVDVVLTDPPYLYLKNQKLERQFDEQAFFGHVKRILKKDGFIVMFGRGTSFYRWNTILADIGFQFKEEIIWDKSYCTSPLMAISRVHETVSIHTKGRGDRAANAMQSIHVGFNEKDIIKQTRDHYSAIHPTQKPVRLLERLLNLVSKPGAVVVDPFMGSGSTAIACLNGGRHFMGWEIDKEYFEGATQRISAHQQEMGLFANTETA